MTGGVFYSFCTRPHTHSASGKQTDDDGRPITADLCDRHKTLVDISVKLRAPASAVKPALVHLRPSAGGWVRSSPKKKPSGWTCAVFTEKNKQDLFTHKAAELDPVSMAAPGGGGRWREASVSCDIIYIMYATLL